MEETLYFYSSGRFGFLFLCFIVVIDVLNFLVIMDLLCRILAIHTAHDKRYYRPKGYINHLV